MKIFIHHFDFYVEIFIDFFPAISVLSVQLHYCCCSQALGAFALIGSVGFLGGVARMTIALTVIVIEATGSLVFGVPIMVTIMITKFVGDAFNMGLYDLHVHLKGIPLLGMDHIEFLYW